MLLSVKECFSSYVFQLENTCNLCCEFCDLWRNQKDWVSMEELAKTIKEDTFFHYNPKKAVYNIIGGEPFRHPLLWPLCDYLYRRGVRVRLWTNGLLGEQNLEKLSRVVSQVQVYFPVSDKMDFHEITGSSQYDVLVRRIELFKTYPWDVYLNVPVIPLNVQWMPFIYEWAYQQQLPIFFHYHPSLFSDRDVVGNIKRFKMVGNHLVLKRRRVFDDRSVCQAVPQEALAHVGDKGRLLWQRYRKKAFFFR